jgi:hypothetical protein
VDDLLFNDQVMSPSEFANKVAGSSRNAWRDLEVRRPVDDEWKTASSLRQSAKAFDQIVNESIANKFLSELQNG